MIIGSCGLPYLLILACCSICGSQKDKGVIRFKIGILSDVFGNVPNITNTSTVTTSKSSYTAITDIFWKHVNRYELYNIASALTYFEDIGVDAVLMTSSMLQYKLISIKKTDLFVLEMKSSGLQHLSTSSSSQIPLCDLKVYDQSDSNVSVEHLCQPPSPKTHKEYPQIHIDSKDEVTKIIVSMFSHFEWSSVYLFYDKTTETKINSITTAMSSLGKLVTLYRIDEITREEIYDLLYRIHDSAADKLANITVICSNVYRKQLLSEANNFDHKNVRKTALRQRTRWVIINLDVNEEWNITDVASELDNVVTLGLTLDSEKGKSKNLNSETQVVEALLSAIIQSLQSHATGYKLISGSLTNRNLIERLVQENNGKHCLCVPIKTLMFVPNGRGLNLVGYVCTTGHLHVNSDIFPNIKFGFNKRKFLVSTLEWQPFTFRTGNVSYRGLCMELLNHLATRFNFTYELTEPADKEWGVRMGNKKWTGLVGQLQRQEVDLVGAPLGVHAGREMVMDFMTSFHYEYSVMLMKKPDPKAKKWRTFIDPFKTEVLICTLVTLPLASLILYLVETFSPYYSRYSADGLHTFQDAFWYMYGAILTQGGEHKPESQAGRTLLSFWWLFCIIMMATYSGNLIAFLTVNKEQLPFNTLNGMLEQKEFKWGTTGGTIWVAMFQETRDPELERVWAGIVEFNASDVTVLDIRSAAHMRKVLQEDYVYIGDKTQAEIASGNQCELKIADQEFLSLQYAFGLPNHSPYTKLFSEEILRVHEAGLLQVWKRRIWPTTDSCETPLISEEQTIKLIDVQSAFYMIGIGVFLSIVTCVSENVLNCLRQRYKKDLPDVPNVVTLSNN